MTGPDLTLRTVQTLMSYGYGKEGDLDADCMRTQRSEDLRAV